MVRLGQYRQVFEAHRDSFQKSGYSQDEAAVLAQAVVSFPIPEAILVKTASYYESLIPNVKILLEYDNFDGVSLKVQNAVCMNANKFYDADDPPWQQLIVSGVYPGDPGTLVVKAQDTGHWYAADWSLDGEGEVVIENVRDIGTYYDTLAVGVTEGIMPALNLLYYAKVLPLQVEQEFLTAAVMGNYYEAPEVVLDGNRPLAEMEFVKFLRNSDVLTESFSTPFKLDERVIEPPQEDALARLAVIGHRLGMLEKAYFRAKIAMAAPLAEAAITEKSTTIQSVVIEKAKFSKTDADAMAKRNGWGSTHEDTDTSYRYRQFSPSECQPGSYRTITLKEGVEGVICKRKSKVEWANGNGHSMSEAGDFRSLGGNDVFVDDDKAKDGNFDDVTKQIKTHNRMRKTLADNDFKKNGYSYNGGEEHVKDAGNGYHVKVSLSAGKGHTTIHRSGGAMVKAVGTATNASQLKDHIDSAMGSAATQPEVSGYAT